MHNQRIDNFKKFYNLSVEEANSATELLDKYLPHGYSEDVVALALRNAVQVSSQSVRHIKAGNYKNTKVFDFIIEFAAENKANEIAAHNSLKENISA